jgi:branched-chain amino acid transport system substrate-binding protein
MASHALEALGLSKIAVLRDLGSDYSVRLADAFEHAFAAGGGTITKSGTYASTDADVALERILAPLIDAEAIYVPGYAPDLLRIATAARKQGFVGRFLGGDGWDAREVRGLGAAVEGTRFTTHFAPDEPRPEVEAFRSAYEKVMNEPPDAMAALGYDTAQFALMALRTAGAPDREKIRQALATGTMAGVTGEIALDEGGNAKKPAVVAEIRDGLSQYVASFAPLSDGPSLRAP